MCMRPPPPPRFVVPCPRSGSGAAERPHLQARRRARKCLSADRRWRLLQTLARASKARYQFRVLAASIGTPLPIRPREHSCFPAVSRRISTPCHDRRKEPGPAPAPAPDRGQEQAGQRCPGRNPGNGHSVHAPKYSMCSSETSSLRSAPSPGLQRLDLPDARPTPLRASGTASPDQ